MNFVANRILSEKIERISGACSTFIPGKNGETGNRGAMTFIGSTDYLPTDIAQSVIRFYHPNGSNTESIILNTYQIDPMPYDYIIYAENHHTYLMYIISVEHIPSQEPVQVWLATTELIDQWDYYLTPEDEDTIDVTVGCIGRQLTIPYMTNGLSNNPVIEQGGLSIKGYADNIIQVSMDYGFRFNVTSRNSDTLGPFRIQLEFNTTQQSPAMDTIIASKFTQSNIKNDLLTFRGYMGNYSCKSDVNGGSYNFDNEKLDNFTVIIKDFKEGLSVKNWSRDICIPKNILINARANNHKYVCKIYGYAMVNKNTIYENTIYDKIYIGDMTDALYNIIDGMSIEEEQTER
jgi:hypothetical protein